MEKSNYWNEKMMREIARQEEKDALLKDPMLRTLLEFKKEKKKINQEIYKMDYSPHSFHSEEEIEAFMEERKRLVFMRDMWSASIYHLVKERAKLEGYQPKSKRKQL